MRPLPKFDWRYLVVSIWIGFSCTLAAWWLIFNLRQIDKLSALNLESASELAGHQRMLLAEGVTLFILLFAGGIALFYYIMVEKKRNLQIKQFFASFTHELRTSITSLRLQAESLQEDLTLEPEHNTLMSRLLQDTARLDLQLENSLLLAQAASSQFFFEDLSLKEIVLSCARYWPNLELEVNQDVRLRGDRRALESIFKNLMQNAVLHGRATKMTIEIQNKSSGKVSLLVGDSGKGFDGDYKNLASLFVRHNKQSGSGIGLYLVKELSKQMHGDVEFLKQDAGFYVQLKLPIGANP